MRKKGADRTKTEASFREDISYHKTIKPARSKRRESEKKTRRKRKYGF